MSKSTLLTKFATLTAAALLSLAGPALAGDQDFELHNETGVEIHALYVSAHDKNEWEEDILGQDTLADGQSLEIKFSPKEEADKWDLRIEDAQGNSVVWDNLTLTEITDVFLRIKDGEAFAETKNGDQ